MQLQLQIQTFPDIAILFRSNLDFEFFTDPANINSWPSETMVEHFFKVPEVVVIRNVTLNLLRCIPLSEICLIASGNPC